MTGCWATSRPAAGDGHRIIGAKKRTERSPFLVKLTPCGLGCPDSERLMSWESRDIASATRCPSQEFTVVGRYAGSPSFPVSN